MAKVERDEYILDMCEKCKFFQLRYVTNPKARYSDVDYSYTSANSKYAMDHWNKYYLESPFKDSGLALYNWSPIADELKVLDKEIVLNSIKLKWNLVENDLKDLTKNLNFN